MTLNEYQALANRTAKRFASLPANLVHASLGLATEGGEFTTIVKRVAVYDKPLDDQMRAHMCEELGDAMWYIALAAEHLEVPLAKICRDNIDKLRERFPDKYTDVAAEARADKDGADARTS